MSDFILVVDDRPAERYRIARALKRAAFETVEAATGEEALDLAKRLPIAIVLDIKLPDITGYEVCRRLKSNPLTSHIPVLEISGSFTESESRLYALESGADAYLAQPADSNVLLATVKSLLRLESAEALARLSAKQWQATFDALSEGVGILDPSHVVQRSNRALCAMLDKSYREIEGRPFGELARECFGVALIAEDAIKGREVSNGSRYFHLSVNPIDGEPPGGSILTLTEITLRKQAEEAWLMSERLAATGRLAHTIAHEINNPLEAVTNLLYLLNDELNGSPNGAWNDKESARKYLSTAEQELGRVSRISRQILAFNRETSKPVPVPTTELLESVLSLHGQALANKGIAVKREWDSSLFVQGFPAQLRQVFSNLLSNAIEASPQGAEIVLRVSSGRLRGKPDRMAVRITIADHGKGIAAKDLPRIFDPFFTTKAIKGSGIGLWLSATIVDQHGGRIQVRSRTNAPSSGACLSVLLPADSPSPDA